MKLSSRAGLLIAFMAVAVVGQRALWAHLQVAAPPASIPLQKPLAELPMQFGDWQGHDEPITDQRSQYADEHLQRLYVHGKTGQVVSVWLVYSGTGADRGHHPEVCLAVAGQTEDPTVRAILDAPGHVQPIQQYRFLAGSRGQWVFYWHYTLPPPHDAQLDALQDAYRRIRTRAASLTLEVFAPESSANDVEAARQFVRALDAAVQEHVGADAVRGSQRAPVTVMTKH